MRQVASHDAEIGQFALILALVLAVVQAAAPLWGAARADGALMAMGRNAALSAGAASSGWPSCAWPAPMRADDFSVALVAAHSNSAQPLIYHLGATWGSHEGSMLLWVLILAVYGGAVALFGGTFARRCARGCWACRACSAPPSSAS